MSIIHITPRLFIWSTTRKKKNPWKSIIDDNGLTKDDFDTGLLYSFNCDWYIENDADKEAWSRQWE